MPVSVLTEHETQVSCVSANDSGTLAVSGAEDGMSCVRCVYVCIGDIGAERGVWLCARVWRISV